MSLDVTEAEVSERRKTADFRPDLAAIRAMSTVLPGALALAVNGVRVAASIRPRKFVIEGGDDTPVTMPAFQIVHPECAGLNPRRKIARNPHEMGTSSLSYGRELCCVVCDLLRKFCKHFQVF